MANEKIFGLDLNDIYRYTNVVEKEEHEYKEVQTVKYKQKMSFETSYYEFIKAISYRLNTSYFRDWDTGRVDFREYSGIRFNGILDNFKKTKEINPKEFNPYFKWFKANYKNEFSYWCHRDHWNMGEGIDILESFIIENIVPYAKKYQAEIEIKKIKKEEIVSIEKKEVQENLDVITNEKRKIGRPLGSKKQKEVEVFLPKHKIPVTEDKKLNIESLILAIADICWRKRLVYSNVLNQLYLTENQIKYVTAMILKKSPSLANKYWQVIKKKDQFYIEPKVKRLGYYLDLGILMSSSEISSKTNIPKRTLCYRLEKMSVTDATKDWKNWKK